MTRLPFRDRVKDLLRGNSLHEADRRVDFIVAGVQKGGTTALWEYLREQPGLQVPIKEVHYFDDEDIDWSRADHRAYHNIFVDDDRLTGDTTPIYIYWPNSLERIARYNPAMKIILLFRDPIERAWSHWKMEYAKGKELHPFDWCIREGRSRLIDADPTAPGHHRVFSYVERGFYGSQLERLFSLFPREQCLLLRSEDLRDDPAPQLAAIARLLGMPAPGSVERRTIHATSAIDYPSTLRQEDRALLADLYHPELLRFEALSGLKASYWTKNWL